MKIEVSIFILQIFIQVSCLPKILKPMESMLANSKPLMHPDDVHKPLFNATFLTESGKAEEKYLVGQTVKPDQISKSVSWRVFNKHYPGGFDINHVHAKHQDPFMDTYTSFFAHGWMTLDDAMTKDCKKFYDAYKLRNGKMAQFVCIDWTALSQISNILHGRLYDDQCKIAMDVGQWFGSELHKLTLKTKLTSNKIQLIGHSLGAHMVGMIGRTFTKLTSNKINYIIGLDPAGPVFVQNKWGLRQHMIKKSDADFVQIIHTNGDLKNPRAVNFWMRLGALEPLGHVDFYVNGGSLQPCWPNGIGCSHIKAIEYYIGSILPNKFPLGRQCANVGQCNEQRLMSRGKTNRMGADCRKEIGSVSFLYEVNIQCWDKGAYCLRGTNCFKCCDGSSYTWWKWSYYCN